MEQKIREQILPFLGKRIQLLLSSGEVLQQKGLQEIRLRVNQPIQLLGQGGEQSITLQGRLTEKLQEGYRVSREELQETLECLSGYSLYAFEEEIRQGFFTIPGGHRIGVAGKIVAEEGRVRYISRISFLNIRIAGEVPGCAKDLLPFLIENQELCPTLILSPPGCGKTTVLRDLIRLISNGSVWMPGKNVGVVDERSELGGMYLGELQNDLGIRTDVLDDCPKAEGMMMLLRSMAPGVIAVDEIGTEKDVQAVERVSYCGCRILATVHGGSLEELKRKRLWKKLLAEGIFERFIVLQRESRQQRQVRIWDDRKNLLYTRFS